MTDHLHWDYWVSLFDFTIIIFDKLTWIISSKFLACSCQFENNTNNGWNQLIDVVFTLGTSQIKVVIYTVALN